MSFRTRVLLALAAVALVPLAVFALGIRQTVADRLAAQFEQRVDALAAVIEADLAREHARLGTRLAGLVRAAQGDNRLRGAVVRGAAGERAYLLDYAGDAMRLAGLDMLQLQDGEGRIVSSGHFRNEFDRLEPELPRLLAVTADGMALVRARSPDGPFLVLARATDVTLGGQRLAVVGGVRVEREFLARLAPDGDLSIALLYPGGALSASGDAEEFGPTVPAADRVVREIRVPYVDAAAGASAVVEARVLVSHPLTALRDVRRSIDAWFVASLAVTAVLALVLAGWVSSRVSRPLTELAHKTAQIDLDRLDVAFGSDRRDEVGALSRLLGAMTERLRASAGRLREAERAAALGELARQVNHDIKNGLVPIRNVLRHLSQVARDEPGGLAAVYDERRGTLDSAVEYLETLARNYARLSPRLEGSACDANAVVRQVLGHAGRRGGIEIRTELADKLPAVRGDPVVLQRILENLVGNAADSFDGESGVVIVSTEPVPGEAGGLAVRLTVSDTGGGMTRGELERAFDDFYTTKPGGTGLGLSIVRRLVLDLGGSLRVDTERGSGSRFMIELPANAEPGGWSG